MHMYMYMYVIDFVASVLCTCTHVYTFASLASEKRFACTCVLGNVVVLHITVLLNVCDLRM